MGQTARQCCCCSGRSCVPCNTVHPSMRTVGPGFVCGLCGQLWLTTTPWYAVVACWTVTDCGQAVGLIPLQAQCRLLARPCSAGRMNLELGPLQVCGMELLVCRHQCTQTSTCVPHPESAVCICTPMIRCSNPLLQLCVSKLQQALLRCCAWLLSYA